MKGLLADPEFRRQRASKAGKARTTPDYLIGALVKRAPELTDAHRAQLAALAAGGAS